VLCIGSTLASLQAAHHDGSLSLKVLRICTLHVHVTKLAKKKLLGSKCTHVCTSAGDQ
jgi:hypothetical protein